jgi:hypothetical protein
MGSLVFFYCPFALLIDVLEELKGVAAGGQN